MHFGDLNININTKLQKVKLSESYRPVTVKQIDRQIVLIK